VQQGIEDSLGAGCVVVSVQLIIGIGAVCIVRLYPLTFQQGLQQLLHHSDSARWEIFAAAVSLQAVAAFKLTLVFLHVAFVLRMTNLGYTMVWLAEW
jgi:hypothetical protein